MYLFNPPRITGLYCDYIVLTDVDTVLEKIFESESEVPPSGIDCPLEKYADD